MDCKHINDGKVISILVISILNSYTAISILRKGETGIYTFSVMTLFVPHPFHHKHKQVHKRTSLAQHFPISLNDEPGRAQRSDFMISDYI